MNSEPKFNWTSLSLTWTIQTQPNFGKTRLDEVWVEYLILKFGLNWTQVNYFLIQVKCLTQVNCFLIQIRFVLVVNLINLPKWQPYYPTIWILCCSIGWCARCTELFNHVDTFQAINIYMAIIFISFLLSSPTNFAQNELYFSSSVDENNSRNYF